MTKIDPRFRRAAKKTTKVVVDDRFKGMFTEEDFVAPVKVDKYGRQVKSDREKKDLEKFYRLEHDEAERIHEHGMVAEDSLPAAGLPLSESGSSSEDDSTVDEDELVMDEALSAHPLVVRDVPVGEATRRLAIVNLDWDQIRADDIYTALHGFKPATGTINSVAIYPSRFGRERMQREAIEGPPRELFARPTDEGEEEGKGEHSTGDSEEGGHSDLDAEVEEELRIKNEDDGEDHDSVALRRYQLERLRYYYAVVDCDSVSTAAHIYRHCDGSEFEKSANFLDLRFIPDHVNFSPEEDGPLKDVATELSKNYRPKPDMMTAAMQKSRVSLTWDADDVERVRITRRPQNGMDAEEEDLRAYLASSESDTEAEAEGEEVTANKYRELLLSGQANSEAGLVYGRKGGKGEEELRITFTSALSEPSKGPPEREEDGEDDEDVHMEAKFASLADPSDGGMEEREGEGEDKTPFQKYLERRKAKKEARKLAGKANKEMSVESKSQRKKRRATEREKQATQAAQLSLLLDAQPAEEEEQEEHWRREGKKSRNSKDKGEGGVEVDVHDPRFAAVFDEPSYALDPSHPSFQKTKVTEQMIKERQKRVHRRQ